MKKKYNSFSVYKESGINSISKMPGEWKLKRLKYLVTYNDDALNENHDPDSVIKYVDISSVDRTKGIVNVDEILFDKAPSRARRLVKSGDTIVSTVRTYLKAIAYISERSSDFVVSTGFAVLRPRKAEMDSRFLGYAIKDERVIGDIVANSDGVSYPAINPAVLVNLYCFQPSIKEQQSIANFLDQKTKQIDDLIEQKEKLLELLTEKRTAIITQAVTKGLPAEAAAKAGLDPKVKMKDSGIMWLGDVPEHWEVIKLKYVASYNDKVLDEKTDSDFEIKYVDISSVSLTGGVSHFEDLTFEKAPSRARRIVRQGDTIISTVRTYLKAICYLEKIPDNTIVSTGFAVIRTRNPNEYHSRFLGYCLQDERLIGDITAYSVGVSYPAINAWDLAQLNVTKPPISEQLRICQFLDNQIKKLDHLSNNIHNSILRLQEYRTSLIASTVTGQIDVS